MLFRCQYSVPIAIVIDALSFDGKPSPYHYLHRQKPDVGIRDATRS